MRATEKTLIDKIELAIYYTSTARVIAASSGNKEVWDRLTVARNVLQRTKDLMEKGFLEDHPGGSRTPAL